MPLPFCARRHEDQPQVPQDERQHSARSDAHARAERGFPAVCDDTHRVLGTVTDRDLVVRALADGAAPTTSVERAMTVDVVACRPEDAVAFAEKMMSDKKKSRIMCIDDGGILRGVISLSDIAQADGSRAAGRVLSNVTTREARS